MAARRVLCFGPFVFDPASLELRRDADPVHLPPKAASVLQVLLERPLELVRKEELLDACWTDAHVGDAVLKVAIREIRRALGDDAARPTYVQTVHRRGYRLAQRVTVRAAGSRAASPTRQDRAAFLVGRDDELAALARAYREVEAGMPRIVLVEGEAGAGKSALVFTFLESLPRRVRVGLGAAGPEGVPPEPYGVMLGALAVLGRTHSSSGMDERVVRALVDHAPTWVAELPALLAAVDAPRVLARRASVAPSRMGRELCDALAALGRSAPVVLVLEDLHLADAATLDVLASAAHAVQLGRTLVVATFRPSASGERAPVAARKDALLVRPSVVPVTLGPLARDAAHALVATRSALGDAGREVVERLHAWSAGNPLVLRLAADALDARSAAADRDAPFDPVAELARLELPGPVRALAEAELASIGDVARDLALLAAAVRRPFSLTSAAAALSRDAGDLERAAESLASTGRLLVAYHHERRAQSGEARREVEVRWVAPPTYVSQLAASLVVPSRRIQWTRMIASRT